MKRAPAANPHRSPQAQAIVFAVLALLVALVTACSTSGSGETGASSEGSGNGEGNGESVETTESVATTTAPAEERTQPNASPPNEDDQTAAVVAALEGLYVGFAAAADPPDPTNELLVANATGDLLASVQLRLSNYQADGTSGGGTINFEVVAVRVSPTTAEVDHCRLDSTFFVTSDDEAILTPDQNAVYVRSDVRLVDGSWQVAAQEFISIDCETECELS